MYDEILKKLFEDARMNWALRPCRNYPRALILSDRAYPTIHIAGSNGKGSVSNKIAKSLELDGYPRRVFLLLPISLLFANESRSFSDDWRGAGRSSHEIPFFATGIEATFFWIDNAARLAYFRAEVDVAVIERGLGGRFECNQCHYPLFNGHTSISREHDGLAGRRAEQIASEKAGILKSDVPVVLGPKAQFKAILNRAAELNCKVLSSHLESDFYDEENSAIARKALQFLSQTLRSMKPA